MKILAVLTFAVYLLLSGMGCNMVQGVGRDITALGEVGQKIIDKSANAKR